MTFLENKNINNHFKINETYLNLEIKLSLEDSFNLIEQIEFNVKNFFKKDLTSLYKRVLNRLKNKDGIVEITPKVNGKLYEFYKTIHFIYTKEYRPFNYSWDINKQNMTQGDVPFLLKSRNTQITNFKQEKDEIVAKLQESKDIKDFISKIKLKNTNIEIVA